MPCLRKHQHPSSPHRRRPFQGRRYPPYAHVSVAVQGLRVCRFLRQDAGARTGGEAAM